MIRIPAILLFTLFIATGTKNSYAQKVFATFHIQLTGTGGKPMKNAFVKIVGEDTTMEAAGEDGQFSFPPW